MTPTISNITSFTINIPESDLSDLKQRLQSTRFPQSENVSDWSQGVPLSTMKDLTTHWIENYSWRNCEAWLEQYPQFLATYSDSTSNGIDDEIFFLHIKSPHRDAMPMLMIHGWPGSVLEFRHVVGPLTDPVKYGGKAEGAFHLIIPLSARGGDWGGDLIARLASEDPTEALVGVHLNTILFDVPKEIAGKEKEDLSAGEQLAISKNEVWDWHGHGYLHLQATRPQTIGYSLSDPPVGLAAWILEKVYKWAQHEGDVYALFSKDEILDNIMVYWLTNSASTAARLYAHQDLNWTMGVKIEVPVGVTVFPWDASYVPRSWAEKYYSNIIHWRDAEQGGHFAAWEQPEIFVREVRETFQHVR